MHPLPTIRRARPLGAALLIAACSIAARAQQGGCGADSTRKTADSTGHQEHETVLPCVRVVASPSKRADAATTVVIPPTVIRSVPATDAWDMVRQAAGMQVHLQGQGPGFASDAAVRGFMSDHSTDVSLSIDGVPVNETVSGHAEGYSDWNAMMPEAVANVDITYGPVSPWAGNFSMGGNVDVKTKPVAVGTEWSARFGSYGDVRLALLTGDAHEDGGWMLAADAQRADGWQQNSQEALGHLMFNKVWIGSGGRTWTLAASTYGGKWNSPGYLDTAQYNAGDLTTAQDTSNGGTEMFGTVRGSLSLPAWGGTLATSLYAHAGWWNIFLTIPPEGSSGEGVGQQTQETDQRYELGGETRWTKSLSDAVHLIAGLQYRSVTAEYQRWLTTDRQRDDPDELVQALYGGVAPVVEAHWDPSAQWSLGLGARVDWVFYATQQIGGGEYSDFTRTLLTPKVSAVYHVTPEFSAYATFNGGWRSSDGVITEPSLAPILENTGEVGVKYASPTFEGSLGLFLIDVHNQQTIDPITLQPSNGGTTRQQGMDLSARAGLERWLAAFVHVVVNNSHYVNLITDSGDTLSGKPVYQVAKYTGEFGFDVDWKGISGSLWAAYMGSWVPVDEPGVYTKPYTLLNLRAVFPISGPWSGVVGMQNILDQKYVEVQSSGFLSPGAPRQLLVTVRHGI